MSRRRRTKRQRKEGGGQASSKMRILEQLVPGSSNMEEEALLAKTANYITLLEFRVSLLRILTILSGLQCAVPNAGRSLSP